METESHPVQWGSTFKSFDETVNDVTQRVWERAYHKGHLYGFVHGIFAGAALATAVMGTLFVR